MADKINSVRKTDLSETMFLDKINSLLSKGIKEAHGVTLVEVLVVMAIIIALTVLVTVAGDWFLRENKLIEYRDQLVSDLEYTKLQSITKLPHYVFLNSTSSQHYYELRELLTDTDGDFYPDAGETIQNIGWQEARGYNCDMNSTGDNDAFCLKDEYNISWTNCGGGSSEELWFDRKGIPRCDTWALGMGTITLYRDENGDDTWQSPELSKTITIDMVGRIRYEQ